ncbi:MAG: tetratricopeptide repeat protein [Tannerellaceae bacterium]|nr:tetratricopeptide repeat protein [Tannerellaceae bacterium]
MKKSFWFITLLWVVYLLASCGTAKNTRATRFYHAVTSNYNIYYNGKRSFDEALYNMQTGYKESYTGRILMYPISAQPKDKPATGGAFDRAIEKGNKAVKMHSIQTKPPKKPGWRNDPKQRAFQEQEEYNPFLKKCWLLIGQGQFYNADFLQASATFSYIARHYAPDEEVVAEARLWQARCYAELAWYYEAEDILGKLNTNGIPAGNLNRYASVYADYLVKNDRTEDAVPYLITAIRAEKNSRQRARMKYLLGQIYAGLGLDGLAYKAFGEVARANPPYELEFAARIRQTEVFPETNGERVIRMLNGMARSDKNRDYLDQVYYALGNIYMARRDTAGAIGSYEQGVEKSTQNGMDKAILWIRLGDIYFQKHDYIKAQPCFSGAAGIISKEYEDYERISKRSAALDELVVHAEAIHLQDSLQTLSRMPEEERLAAIDRIIEQVVREEEEAKEQARREAYLAEAGAQGTGIERAGTDINVPVLPTIPGESSFYFYNSQMVAQGKTQFQRRWGRRTLEDDWRRRSRRMTTFDDVAGGAASETADGTAGDYSGAPADSLNASLPEGITNDNRTREYYLQQIPFTEEEKEASDLIIIDGLYNMAMIYKDKLEDLPLAVEGFEELERRFPVNEHLLESYYQVYLMSLRMQDRAMAEAYKARMLASFPGSDYTTAIADPAYEYNIRSMDSVQSAIYESTYHSYLAGDTTTVRLGYEAMAARYPLASLLPKFMFLNALTYVQKGDVEGFKTSLRALVEKYPKADVSELAGEMLKGVLRGRELVQGSVKGMVWNLRFGLSDDGTLAASDSARTFTAEKNQPCRIVMIYPAGSIDRNQLLFVVAAYNFASFMVKEFDVALDESGPLGTLTVSGFINFDEVLQYYRMIYGKDGYASALSSEIAVIPISGENYETLMRGKTLDEYILFLEENFSEEAPELIARLRSRSDAALTEEDTPRSETTTPELSGPEVMPAAYPEEEESTEVEAEVTEEAGEIVATEEAVGAEVTEETGEAEITVEAAATALPPEPSDTTATVTTVAEPISGTIAPAVVGTPQTPVRSAGPDKTPAQTRREKEREYKRKLKEQEKAQKAKKAR